MKKVRQGILVKRICFLLTLILSFIVMLLSCLLEFNNNIIIASIFGILCFISLIGVIWAFLDKLDVYHYNDNEIGIYCGIINKYLFVNDRKVYKVRIRHIFDSITLNYYNDELDIEVYVKKIHKTSIYVNGEIITK